MQDCIDYRRGRRRRKDVTVHSGPCFQDCWFIFHSLLLDDKKKKKKVCKKSFPLIGHVVDLENNWPVSACINPLSYSCKSHKKRLMILKMSFLIMCSGLIQFIAFPCISCLGYNNISCYNIINVTTSTAITTILTPPNSVTLSCSLAAAGQALQLWKFCAAQK